MGPELREIGFAHQVTITLTGSAPPFMESPDHQTLTTPTIPRCEHALNAGRIRSVLSLGVTARIALYAELLKDKLLWAQETHRQQDKLRRQNLLRAGHFLRCELALVVLLPLNLNGMHGPHLTAFVSVEFFGCGKIDARI